MSACSTLRHAARLAALTGVVLVIAQSAGGSTQRPASSAIAPHNHSPGTTALVFTVTGTVTLNLQNYDEYVLQGTVGGATMLFSPYNTADILVASNSAGLGISSYPTASSDCPGLPAAPPTCTTNLGALTFTNNQWLQDAAGQYFLVQGSNGQYVLVNIVASTSRAAGQATDGVTFTWYATDSTTAGLPAASVGTPAPGVNVAGGSSTALNFVNSGTVTVDFDNYDSLQILGPEGVGRVTFDNNAGVIFYGSDPTALYTSTATDCTSLTTTPNCTTDLSQVVFSQVPNKPVLPGDWYLLQGTHHRYFLLNFTKHLYAQTDGYNGIVFNWYATDIAANGSQYSTVGSPIMYGMNSPASASSTALAYVSHGTIMLNFANQNGLQITGPLGSADIEFSVGNSSTTWLGSGFEWSPASGVSGSIQSPTSRYDTESTDCTAGQAALTCQTNLAPIGFTTSAKLMNVGEYALVMGTNGQYFLLCFTQPSAIFDGGAYDGLVLDWYSVDPNATASAVP